MGISEIFRKACWTLLSLVVATTISGAGFWLGASLGLTILLWFIGLFVAGAFFDFLECTSFGPDDEEDLPGSVA